MLTDKQQTDARRALEEWVADTTTDPVRVQPDHLDNLQVLLAGRGLEIATLTKASTDDYLPASAIRTATDTLPLTKHAQDALAAPQVAPVTNRLTPAERGQLTTAEMAAHEMRHLTGFCFKAPTVLGLTKIIRRLAGEPK